MKWTVDVYFSLHIPAALFQEPIRYDSVRSITAKIGRYTVADWRVGSIVWKWGVPSLNSVDLPCTLTIVSLCVSDSSASPGKRKNSKVDFDCFPLNRYRFAVQGISAFGDQLRVTTQKINLPLSHLVFHISVSQPVVRDSFCGLCKYWFT
jgi:hypothetical protein